MTHHRLAYDDADTTITMAADCAAAAHEMHLPARKSIAERAAAAVVEPAPSILFEDYPREVPKREIRVSDAAARLAAGMHLHFD